MTIILLALFALAAGAQEAPLVRHPDIPQEQLAARAAADRRETLAESLERQRPTARHQRQVRGLLENGQRAWLSGSVVTARANFTELAALALEDDWREAEREAIQYAMVRLAQASTELESERWLEKAATTFPDLDPDPQLFPPPLMIRFRRARALAAASARELALGERFADQRFVLINGRKYEIKPSLRIVLPQSRYRVTLFSDAYAPLTEIVSTNKIADLQAKNAIVKGDCSSPFDNSKELKTYTALFAEDCVRNYTGRAFEPRSMDLQARALPNAGPPVGALVLPSEVPPAKPFISKKGWMWIGGTTLLAAIVYAVEENKRSQSSAPTETKVVPRRHVGL